MKESKENFIKKMMDMQKQIKGEKPVSLLEIENKPIDTRIYEQIANCTR